MIINCSIVTLGPESAVEKAKLYYEELGDKGHSIIKKALKLNEDIDIKLRGQGIIWPQGEHEVLSSDGFFNDPKQLNWEQAIILLECFQEIAQRVTASGQIIEA